MACAWCVDRRWGSGEVGEVDYYCACAGWAHRDDVFVYVLAEVPAGLAVAAVVIRETGEGVCGQAVRQGGVGERGQGLERLWKKCVVR